MKREEYDRFGNALPALPGEHAYSHHAGVFDAPPPEHARRRAELEECATASTARERARQRAREQEAMFHEPLDVVVPES